jgi:hypothetical protein
MGTPADQNSEAPSVDALRASEQPSREGDTMKITGDAVGPQARLVSLRHPLGATVAVVELTADGRKDTVCVEIRGLSEQKGKAMLQAVTRLLSGALVMDGNDVRQLTRTLDESRGMMSYLAPEACEATAAIGLVESAMARMDRAVAS